MPLTLNQRPASLPPEILDELPAQHPDAVASRRDLRYFNSALGNWSWFRREIGRRMRANERALELGAGTGELGEILQNDGVAWDGIDRAPRPPNWATWARWHQGDIFDFDAWDTYPVVAGNLILHHFNEDQLTQLGAALNRHARLIMIGDLRRGRWQQLSFFVYARWIGANHVSLHDGSLSVRAGFRGQELPEQLGLNRRDWVIELPRGHVSAYRMIATRRS
ncbi:MAG TPA: hypothetical protein VFT72_20810 [Opitutaceae bacterium]|nr:hypothetical protein [Opitutaceae bacterium]